MEEQLIFIGFLVVFVGIIIIFIGSFLSASKPKESKFEWGVGGFIGPIPFGFGNNPKMVYLIMIVSLILFILFFIFTYKLF